MMEQASGRITSWLFGIHVSRSRLLTVEGVRI